MGAQWEIPFVVEGVVIAREEVDPQRGRIKVRIPGLMDESAWAYPSGWGWRNGPVPPLNAVVEVFFLNGDRDQPRWRESHARTAELFAEFTHPDVTVCGDSKLRIIRDPRPENDYTAVRAVELVNGVEDVLIELFISHKDRALRIYSAKGMKIESEGELAIESAGDVDVQGRKVLPRNKPIA
jgi:hypothetical protein